MSELELILNLARDVEKLLQKAGVLGSLEKHAVVKEIEAVLGENTPPAEGAIQSVPTPAPATNNDVLGAVGDLGSQIQSLVAALSKVNTAPVNEVPNTSDTSNA